MILEKSRRIKKNQEIFSNPYNDCLPFEILLHTKYCFKTEMDYVLAALNLYDYHGIECFSIIRQLFLEKQKKERS